MKALVSVLVLAFSLTAFAGEPKAALYKKTAEDTIVNLYGKDGDVVDSELVDMVTDEATGLSYEVWSVSLNNNINVGSIAFEVLVAQNGELVEGQASAVVSVKFLYSN